MTTELKRALKVIGSTLTAAFLVFALAIIPVLRAARTQAPVARTKVLLQAVRSACNTYSNYYGDWPASLSDLTHTKSNIVFMEWGEEGASDAWGHPLVFKPFSSVSGFGSIRSYGRDGRAGGEGPDAGLEVRFGDTKQ